jgi:hypothetical protein
MLVVEPVWRRLSMSCLSCLLGRRVGGEGKKEEEKKGGEEEGEGRKGQERKGVEREERRERLGTRQDTASKSTPPRTHSL